MIVNAAESVATSRPNDRHVTIVTTRHSAGQIRVSISDSGKGLTRQQLDQVFEPFYTTKSQGLGLGLAICRSIVLAHGGRIWATNNAEGGATFHFTLPLAADGPAPRDSGRVETAR